MLHVAYPNNLKEFKKDWVKYTYHNFSLKLPLVTIPEQLSKFKLEDGSIYNYYELDNINYMTNFINFEIKELYHKIDVKEKYHFIKNEYKKCGFDTKKYLKYNQFSSIFLSQHQKKCVTTLINIIHEIRGAEKWLIDDYKSLYETDDEIMSLIKNDPEFISCEHDGETFHSTFLHTKKYFTIGRHRYAKMILDQY
jgi:hypothetical protein